MAIVFRNDMDDTTCPDAGGGGAGFHWYSPDGSDGSLIGDDIGQYTSMNYSASASPIRGLHSGIATAYNRPGSRGKGCRQIRWGTNQSTSLYSIVPNVACTEMWFRRSIKFESGFSWEVGGGGDPHYMKLDYINHSDARGMALGFYGASPVDGKKAWGLFIASPDDGGGSVEKPSDLSWYASQGNSQFGDGQWHTLEYHLKQNTSSGASDGIFELWWDGVQYAAYTNISYHTALGGWDWWLQDNHDFIEGEWILYQDDFEMWNSGGPIGPISGAASATPRRGAMRGLA